jgi:hypothetical protein
MRRRADRRSTWRLCTRQGGMGSGPEVRLANHGDFADRLECVTPRPEISSRGRALQVASRATEGAPMLVSRYVGRGQSRCRSRPRGGDEAVCAEQRVAPAAWIRDLQELTKGQVMVQLSLDIGVEFPVEVFGERGPGYVGPGTLGLSRDLEVGLTRWQLWWADHVEVCGDEVTGRTIHERGDWSQEGNRLRERLGQQLRSRFRVRSV